MPRADRTQRLLDLLSTGAEPTQHELAEQLGCDERTVRRHLGKVRKSGVPVQEKQDGHLKRYFLAEEERHHALRTVRLTERQLQALTAAIEAARAALRPTPLLSPLEAAAQLLTDEWLAQAFTFEPDLEAARWSFEDDPTHAVAPEVFWTLLEAMRHQQPVLADYFTASRRELTEGRKLDPYLFAIRRGSWMATCYCHDSRQVKEFALKGFRRVARCAGEHFVWKKSFDRAAHFAGRFASVAGREVHTVRLLVDAESAPYFRRKRYHASQEIEEERPGGEIVVRMAARSLEEVCSWVLSWRGAVRVLAPEALAEAVREAAEALLQEHAPPQSADDSSNDRSGGIS